MRSKGKTLIVRAAWATALAGVTAVAASQTGKKPATTVKPTQAKPVEQQRPPVKGTAQLPGDNGQIGQAYTLGTTEPINFTLDSAEYTVKRVVMGETVHAPEGDEKLLVI